MNLHDLSPAPGSKQEKVRKGRGTGSPDGEKTGLGTKGQNKRSQIPVFFEGGQTPLYKRLPKYGFTPPNQGPETEEVNVSSLNKFDKDAEVTPDALCEAGLINKTEPVKLLGDGDLDVAVNVRVHSASEGARKKVESAGGRIDLIRSGTGGS